jgi:hypothetical protein
MYDHIDSFGKFEQGSTTLMLSQISCIALGLALLEDEQKYKFGDLFVLIKHRFHVLTCQVNL